VFANSTWEVTTLADRAGAAWQNQPLLAVGFVLLGIAAAAVFFMVLPLGLVYAERKVAARFQCRVGPMRVGWHGTLQTLADALKLLTKEDIVPQSADRFLHTLAPILALMASVLAIVVIPMSPLVQLADLNIGVVYVTAVASMGVLGVLLGGWSSYNKWSLLGAMRAGAQIISYEISAVLSILVAVLFAGTLSLAEIVQSQADGWWIWRGHVVGFIGFFVFLIASTAELNRTPFDIPEGESELTAGFHTEFSGMRFAFFFLAEFLNMFVVSAFAATLFLGGWMPFHIGGWDGFNAIMDLIPAGVWFTLKTVFLIFVLMWFRWTFPRLRVDQLMSLEWKFLLPLSITNLMLAAVVVLLGWYFFPLPAQ
jgi:NADH-quinone oxidoreductase subunit H